MSKRLIDAITINNIELIKELVDNGADVNAVVAEGAYAGFIALHIAVIEGKTKVVSVLVNECGADVNAVVIEGVHAGYTALHIAANSGKTEVVLALVNECGADVNASITEGAWIGMTALHIAARLDKTEIVRLLVNECGVDVNAVVTEGSYAGKSALHIAADCGKTEIVSALLEFGCVIDDEVTSSDPRINNLLSKYRNANNHVDDGESLAYVNDLAFAIFNALRLDSHSNVKPANSMLDLFKYKGLVGESNFTLAGYELSELPCYIFYADLLSDYTKSLLNPNYA